MGAGFLLAPGAASACAVCGLDDASFLWSMLFLMGMPFAVAGTVGGVVLYSARGDAGKHRTGWLRRLFRSRQEKPF